MKQKNHTRESLEKEFSENKKLKIVFTKKDGSERTMICSRHFDLLPESSQPSGQQEKTSSRPHSETNFPVFDLEKGAWRTFTIANLISIQSLDMTNLCETCLHTYPECMIEPDGVIFGNGCGGDNIISCNSYESYEVES